MISGNVLKALDKTNVRDFMVNNGIDLKEKAKEYEIDMEINNFEVALLNQLILNEEISKEKVNDFLVLELNYGKMKNVFLKFINICLVKDLEDCIKRINSLEDDGFENASDVSSQYYQKDLWTNIDVGKKRLVYSSIDNDEREKVDSINLLLAEGIKVGENQEDRANNYYSIEINLKLKYVAVRVRNWSTLALNQYTPDKVYDKIKELLLNRFGIVYDNSSEKYVNAIYSIIYDLTDKALADVCSKVDGRIKADIVSCSKKWWKEVLNEIEINEADTNIITNSILNNYYKYYMKKTYGKITRKKMVDDFGLYAYPRRVVFEDDTVGEGKATSPTPQLSLFDTAVFYDLKARFEHSKKLLWSTIYWLKCPQNECFGTSIYTDEQNLIKIVYLPLKINKEMCDYVLHQIKRNFR